MVERLVRNEKARGSNPLTSSICSQVFGAKVSPTLLWRDVAVVAIKYPVPARERPLLPRRHDPASWRLCAIG